MHDRTIALVWIMSTQREGGGYLSGGSFRNTEISSVLGEKLIF